MFKLEKFIFQSLPFLHAIRYTISKRIRKITQFAGKIYYSQTGEDIILKVLFERQNHGIYVDVGCNHPIKDSNTFHLYMSGWSGICIDANPELCRLFGKIRKRDVILHRAISNSTENETLY